jgi:hypothetical protein
VTLVITVFIIHYLEIMPIVVLKEQKITAKLLVKMQINVRFVITNIMLIPSMVVPSILLLMVVMPMFLITQLLIFAGLVTADTTFLVIDKFVLITHLLNIVPYMNLTLMELDAKLVNQIITTK